MNLTPTQTITWNQAEIRSSGLLIRAVRHELRQRMLDAIFAAGSINVTDLYIKLRIDQTVCSQHLRILRNAGLVDAEERGVFVYYSVNMDQVEWAMETIAELAKKR